MGFCNLALHSENKKCITENQLCRPAFTWPGMQQVFDKPCRTQSAHLFGYSRGLMMIRTGKSSGVIESGFPSLDLPGTCRRGSGLAQVHTEVGLEFRSAALPWLSVTGSIASFVKQDCWYPPHRTTMGPLS